MFIYLSSWLGSLIRFLYYIICHSFSKALDSYALSLCYLVYSSDLVPITPPQYMYAACSRSIRDLLEFFVLILKSCYFTERMFTLLYIYRDNLTDMVRATADIWKDRPLLAMTPLLVCWPPDIDIHSVNGYAYGGFCIFFLWMPVPSIRIYIWVSYSQWAQEITVDMMTMNLLSLVLESHRHTSRLANLETLSSFDSDLLLIVSIVAPLQYFQYTL